MSVLKRTACAFGLLFAAALPASAETFTFEDAVDTYIWEIVDDVSYGSDSDITVDGNWIGGEAQALLTFTDFALPQGVEVISAGLTLFTNNPTPGTINFHTLLTPFSETSTWSSFRPNGIQTNDVEASSLVGGTLENPSDDTFVTVDITDIVRQWQSQPTVFGVVILTDSPNGWDFDSAETSRGPTLTVETTNVSTTPVPIPTGIPLVMTGILALAGFRRMAG